MTQKLGTAAILLIPALMASCGGGGSGPKVQIVPAAGTVNFNGAPLADAMLAFIPDEGPAGTAKSDAEGKFIVKTNGQSGAAIGRHKVTVAIDSGDGGIPPMDGNEMEAANKSVLPAKYSDPATTDLIITLTEDGNEDLVLDLTP